MNIKKQRALARDMKDFLEATPMSSDLDWTKDNDYLFHFEAARQLIVRDFITKVGIRPDENFQMLDFGYLHGLTQEFTHRAFPGAQITVCDLPSSPIFSDAEYQKAIGRRDYLKLVPRSIDEIGNESAKVRLIMLGEIIEHLDPTQTARAIERLRKLVTPGGALIITTPNASGLYNCWMTMTGGDAIQLPPIPDKTHGYGHIHLWSPKLLRATAEHHGWQLAHLEFYHGREGEKFEEVNSAWVSLKAQIMIRAIKLIGNLNPNLRGFFVAAFVPRDSS